MAIIKTYEISPLSEEEIAARVEANRQHVEYQVDHPMDGDMYIAACAEATAELYDKRSYQDLLSFFAYSRPNISPNYSFNIWFRNTQSLLLANDPDDYPIIYDEKEPWERAYRWIQSDPEIWAQFLINLSSNVTSNVSERYKGFVLAGQMYKDRFDGPITALDIGCSQNLGYKKIINKDQMPFMDVAMVRRGKGRDSVRVDPIFTQAVNRLLDQTFELGPSVGMDILSANDPVVRQWAKSCSFYPKELLNRSLVRQYDALDNSDPEQLSFHRNDITNFSYEAFMDQYGKEPQFDMVTLSTMLYQITDPKELHTALETAKKLTKPEGIVVIQDFVTRVKHKPHELYFHPLWAGQEYIYSTLVFDKRHPEAGYLDFLRWRNGRCVAAEAGADFGRIAMHGSGAVLLD